MNKETLKVINICKHKQIETIIELVLFEERKVNLKVNNAPCFFHLFLRCLFITIIVFLILFLHIAFIGKYSYLTVAINKK